MNKTKTAIAAIMLMMMAINAKGQDCEHHTFVDLGLPSGTLWSETNLGACGIEGVGDIFSWGDTIPQTPFGMRTQVKYITKDKWLTKYCSDSFFGDEGYYDDLTVLQVDDDAAAAIWGAEWRVPTTEQWRELMENTTKKWSEWYGVIGCFLTGPNGKRIFLPAAGACYDNECFNQQSSGYYWSSSLDVNGPDCAWSFVFNAESGQMISFPRTNGFSIRPVRASNKK